jgi:hypothetical protein
MDSLKQPGQRTNGPRLTRRRVPLSCVACSKLLRGKILPTLTYFMRIPPSSDKNVLFLPTHSSSAIANPPAIQESESEFPLFFHPEALVSVCHKPTSQLVPKELRRSSADLLLRLKCNREQPCQNCIVRGEGNAASCTYAEKAEKKSHALSNPRSDAEDMRKRLNRLETSIISMMSSDNERTGSQTKSSALHVINDNSIDESPNQAGGQRMSLDIRSTHWDAILNDVCHFQSIFFQVDVQF